MRKLLFTFTCVAFLAMQNFAVECVSVNTNSIKFYNWSSSDFDLTGMKVSVGANWHDIANLTIKSGTISVKPGEYIEFTGINAANDKGSIGLWYQGVNQNNPTAGFLASFVQYGAASQPYEAQGVAASLWGTGDFVASTLPIARDNDYSSFGVSHWSGGNVSLNEFSAIALQYGPNPFIDQIHVMNGSSFSTISLSNSLGQTLFYKEGLKEDQLSISTDKLENGLYFLYAKDENGNYQVYKLIK